MQLRMLLVAPLTLALAGCGTYNLGKVEGTVTLDGKPLHKALVMFTPLDGTRPSTANTDENGHYRLFYTPTDEGADLGRHKVTIRVVPQSIEADNDKAPPKVRIPARYNDRTTLTAEVQPSNNTIDFALTSDR